MVERWAVLWDLDGTLVDTGRLHFKSWKTVLEKYGRGITYDEFAHTFGMNNTAVIGHLYESPTAEFIDELGSAKETYFRSNVRGNVAILPGAIDWLARFRSLGWPQAIVSSAPMANVQALVDAMDLRPYFALLLSAENMPSKPDPAVFLQAARELNVVPERSIVFEDAPAGVEGARRAGMKSIALLTTHPAESLSTADLVVPGLDQLSEEELFRILRDS